MSFVYNSNQNNKITATELKKVESIKEIINRSNARNATDNWRKHIPVYGWAKMNYPTTICPPISEKYIKQQKEYEEKENQKRTQNDIEQKLILEQIHEPLYDPNNKWRLNPDKVNQDVVNGSKNYFFLIKF